MICLSNYHHWGLKQQTLLQGPKMTFNIKNFHHPALTDVHMLIDFSLSRFPPAVNGNDGVFISTNSRQNQGRRR